VTTIIIKEQMPKKRKTLNTKENSSKDNWKDTLPVLQLQPTGVLDPHHLLLNPFPWPLVGGPSPSTRTSAGLLLRHLPVKNNVTLWVISDPDLCQIRPQLQLYLMSAHFILFCQTFWINESKSSEDDFWQRSQQTEIPFYIEAKSVRQYALAQHQLGIIH
jgi:hypothetical protein